ncbi:MAG TPA: peptidylprolyl isomerase [Bacteroidales bacterium]|nr:peptidylprolyl isomerase [Bacteroidales bacterium]
MKRSLSSVLIPVFVFMAFMNELNSQKLVESVAAIIGNEVIYLSDVENTVNDQRRSGSRRPVDQLRCEVFEELLISKLFLDQARIDSIVVTDDMVEGELNMRMNDAIRQAGSEKTLTEYFKKSMVEIRRDIRKAILEQQIVSEVQMTIAEDINLTPAELKRFVASIPKDSLPVIPAKVQISLIQLDPPENEENKATARQKLLDIRSEILAGKSFNVLAVMYSEDPGSAVNGGEIGYKTRGELEKEYADAAFSLTKNTVSKIVETKFGFHIIQLIDRKGDLVNSRHILIRPKVTPQEAARAISKLDSIARLIRKDSLKFENAAIRFSSHKDSRINGGKFVSTNPSSRINWFTLDEFSREMYIVVRDMKVGEISEPFRTTDEDGNIVFRIIRLDDELPAHRANLKDDYQYLYGAALMNKRNSTYESWIRDKIENTYIKISEEFKICDFLAKGWLK